MEQRLEQTKRKITYEIRESESGEQRIEGVAANLESYDMGSFTESIAPGAFGDLNSYDVRALVNHDNNQLLARSKFGKGSLKLSEVAGELRYSFNIPNTSIGMDAMELLKRGDIAESSWQFSVADDTWNFDSDTPHRTINKVAEIRDVSLVTFPANPSTSVELRSMEDAKKNLELKNKAMNEEIKKEAPVVEERAKEVFIDASAVGSSFAKSEERNFKGFNVEELVHQVTTGKLTGVFAELDQEGRSEAAAKGQQVNGPHAFHMPEELRQSAKKTFEARQNTVTAGNQPVQGANTVQDEFQEFIRFLYPDTPVLNLCKKVNAKGNAWWPQESVTPVMQWGTEIQDTTIQDVEWTKSAVTPERARILCGYSRRLQHQFVSGSVNSDLTTQINNAFNTGIESALLQGSGTGSEPTGLLTQITPTAVGALTLAQMVNLFELAVKKNDALMGKLAYVTTPQVEAFMKYTQALPNGSRTLAQPGNELQRLDNQMSTTGYPLYSTTVMGQATPVTAESMIFGNFNDVALVMWGGPVLMVNPYSQMNKSVIEIYAERQMNVKILREESFVVSKDVNVS